MAPEEHKKETMPYSVPSVVLPQEIEGGKEPTLSSRVAWLLLGDVMSPGQAFERWLALVRQRSMKYRDSGFPHRASKPHTADPLMVISIDRSSGGLHSGDCDIVNEPVVDQASAVSLWKRLGDAATLDIESNDFCWHALSSLHHTEHTGGTDHSEDEMNKALEVTVNSGGVVFFALFSATDNDDTSLSLKEAAAVIKFASSKMATQSERLGYEFAKLLGVETPQARVIHNSSVEWQRIKDAAEKARDISVSTKDEVGEITCTELLEALELSRCLFLMNYVHGSPLLETSHTFDSHEASEKCASALGRVLMLDLVLRNEDRLPCRQLGWRGNTANLLYADKVAFPVMDTSKDAIDPVAISDQHRNVHFFRKEKSLNSLDGIIAKKPGAVEIETGSSSFHVLAIDSGVPRRPPAVKRTRDQEVYPKVVELMLNNSDFAACLLHEISAAKLGFTSRDNLVASSEIDMVSVVHEFRLGFRAALRELQGFHIFLLSLYQKLDGLLRVLLSIINKSSGDLDKEEFESPTHSHVTSNHLASDTSFFETHRSAIKMTPGCHESPDLVSLSSRESWAGRHSKGSGDHPRSLRLTMKLRDFIKIVKVDAELSKELEQWNEMLRADVVQLCLENNFNTGFFEGNDSNIAVDAYELKVRLEHILERISLISEAANTERPSLVMGNIFIGGTLAARSVHTLQHLGITHILCLCSHEIGQSDSQYPDLFQYKNFPISDEEDADMSGIFEEASDFIHRVEAGSGGRKILVHCFEGKSRSATIVLAYLMLKKGMTLSEAWRKLKKAHKRAQPNDGFAGWLVELDKRIHGEVSMEWQQRRPAMKVCSICGKNAGLSISSLNLHLQKAHHHHHHHRRVFSGSVDSAMKLEIHRAALPTICPTGRASSLSPNKLQDAPFPLS